MPPHKYVGSDVPNNIYLARYDLELSVIDTLMRSY